MTGGTDQMTLLTVRHWVFFFVLFLFLNMVYVREGAWDKAARDPNDEMVSAGLTPDNIRKWEYLTGVQGQNETVRS